MFILYTVAPLLYRLASSAYFNLSLLSSDFYGLLFGMIHLIFKFSVDTCAGFASQDFSSSYVELLHYVVFDFFLARS